MLYDQGLMIKNAAKNIKLVFKDVPENMQDALKTFVKGDTGRFGNYFATKNALVHRTLSTLDGYNQEVLLLRLVRNGQVHYLGNSSRLEYVESRISFGRRSRHWGQTAAQRCLVESGFPMLPFSSFQESGLKITETIILDRGPEEMVNRVTGQDRKGNPKLESVHFTGASLFQIGEKTFLFDIDREEIKHNIFNPFITEVPGHPQTVSDAYDKLIPMEVRTAQLEGKEVLRQGEHFLIKIADQDAVTPTMRQRARWDNESPALVPMEGRLTAQGNRDHVASLFNQELGLVSGLLKHNGREHKDLELKAWYKPVPNTGVRSFTLTGDID